MVVKRLVGENCGKSNYLWLVESLVNIVIVGNSRRLVYSVYLIGEKCGNFFCERKLFYEFVLSFDWLKRISL